MLRTLTYFCNTFNDLMEMPMPARAANPPSTSRLGSPTDGPLLRPAASCPRCGSRPALRATAALTAAVRSRPPEERLGTYQCQRRECGQVYALLAQHFHDAS
jgi:hypothetical protein